MLTLDLDSRDLMARAQQGDGDAFGALFIRHRLYLRAVINRRIGGFDDGLVEDLMQETMLRAWRARGRYTPTCPDVRAWLATIARNLIVDHYRARSARFDEQPVGMAADVPAAGHDPYHAVDDHEQVEQLLAALSDMHREVLTMHYLEERTCAAIAARTGTPEGTVKRRLDLARRAARALAVADV